MEQLPSGAGMGEGMGWEGVNRRLDVCRVACLGNAGRQADIPAGKTTRANWYWDRQQTLNIFLLCFEQHTTANQPAINGG